MARIRHKLNHPFCGKIISKTHLDIEDCTIFVILQEIFKYAQDLQV